MTNHENTEPPALACQRTSGAQGQKQRRGAETGTPPPPSHGEIVRGKVQWKAQPPRRTANSGDGSSRKEAAMCLLNTSRRRDRPPPASPLALFECTHTGVFNPSSVHSFDLCRRNNDRHY